jgi:threonine/homoserine/homoserine lactone efflux protein
MGMFAFIAGLITVMGTMSYLESQSTINNLNIIAIVIQFAGGLFLMYLGTEILQENTNH